MSLTFVNGYHSRAFPRRAGDGSDAIAGGRDEVSLFSKAYPQKASLARLPRPCEAGLKRLGTDRLYLYLLHWRGNIPLAQTVEATQAIKRGGKIWRRGVSSDTDNMEELVDAGGSACVADQILYKLIRRGPEHDRLRWPKGSAMPIH